MQLAGTRKYGSSLIIILSIILMEGCNKSKKKDSPQRPQNPQKVAKSGDDSEYVDDISIIAKSQKGSETPLSLSVIADSIGTGIFASHPLSEGITDQVKNKLDFKISIDSLSSEKIGTLVNSLLDQFDLDKLEEKFSEPDNSAFSGRAEWALPNLLGIDEGNVYKSAIAGSHTQIIDTHIEMLKEVEKSVKDEIDYLLFSLGNNDYCDKSLSASQFKENYKKALEKYVGMNHHKKSHLVIVPILNVPHLKAITEDELYTLYDEDDFPTIAPPSVSCKQIQEQMCEVLASDIDHKNRLLQFNNAIKEVAGEFESAERKVTVIESIGESEFDKEDLAFDCFHPSQQGQKKLAVLIKESL